MKTLVLFFAAILISLGISAQIYQGSAEEIVVTPPVFTGEQFILDLDQASIENYVANRFQYPADDAKRFVQGTEVIQFVVNTNGTLSDFTVMNSVSEDIDEEVIRVLKTTDGMWRPGTNNEGAVAMLKEVNIACKVVISEDSDKQPDFKAMATHHFSKGAKLLYAKEHPKRALKQFNQGINYRPYDANLLLMRGYCKLTLGDKQGAYDDWEIVKEKTDIDHLAQYVEQFDELEGFAELVEEFESLVAEK